MISYPIQYLQRTNNKLFSDWVGLRCAPLALQNLAEANKQNIFMRIEICQRILKYLNSNEELLKSIIIFELEYRYLFE